MPSTLLARISVIAVNSCLCPFARIKVSICLRKIVNKQLVHFVEDHFLLNNAISSQTKQSLYYLYLTIEIKSCTLFCKHVHIIHNKHPNIIYTYNYIIHIYTYIYTYYTHTYYTHTYYIILICLYIGNITLYVIYKFASQTTHYFIIPTNHLDGQGGRLEDISLLQ